MKKKIIVINGQGGSGKDTFIKYCGYISKWPVYSFSSVSIVKKAAKILGWEGSKSKEDRKFLSDLKQLSINYNNQPNEYLVYSVEKTPDISLNFVIIREPKEIDVFKSSFFIGTDIHTVLVDRFDNEWYGNVSDDETSFYKYDYIVYNKGIIEELITSSKKFLDWLEVPYNEDRYIEVCNSGSWDVWTPIVSDRLSDFQRE